MKESYKLMLRMHEFDTLITIFEQVIIPSMQRTDSIQEKLFARLLLQIYDNLRKADGLIKKEKYIIKIPATSAMAFHIYWLKTPIANIITSHLINRVIGEIDKQFA